MLAIAASYSIREPFTPPLALVLKEQDRFTEFRVCSWVLTPPANHRTRAASSARIAARPS